MQNKTRKPFSLIRWIEIAYGDRFILRGEVCIVKSIDEGGGMVYLLAQEVDDPSREIVTTGFLPPRYWIDKDWIYRDRYYHIIVRERAMKNTRLRQKRPPFKLGLPRRALSGRFYQAQVDFEWPKPEPFDVDEDFKNFKQGSLFDGSLFDRPRMNNVQEWNKETEKQTLEDYENDYKIRNLDW